MRIFYLIFLLLLPLHSFSQCSNWTVLPLAPMPEKITNNAVCEGRNGNTQYAFSFGGIDTSLIWSGISRKSFRYNLTSNTWDTIPSLPDTLGKIASSATCIGDTIYIIGGYYVFQNGNEISSNRVHRYVISTNTYISDGTPVPVAIDDQVQAVFADSLIYVITGWSNTTSVSNVQIYNVRTNTWTTGTPVPNAGSYRVFGASGIIQGHTIYYYGGASNGNNFPATTVVRKGIIDSLNPTQITWSIADTITSKPGYRTAAIGFRYSLTMQYAPVWVGGSNVSYNFNALAYNGSGTVHPPGVILQLDAASPGWTHCTGTGLPMDQRGVAEIGSYQTFDYAAVICGGIDSSRKVTSSAYLLGYMLTGTQEPVVHPELQIYPNPASGNVTVVIKGNNVSAGQIIVTDFAGRVCLSEQVSWLSTVELQTEQLENGCYILTAFVNGVGTSQLIMISRN